MVMDQICIYTYIFFFQKVFSDQHIDYLKHKSDKHAYEKQLWDKKLYRIRCSIAARKIQRYFRLYLKIAAKFESQTPKKSKSRQKSILGMKVIIIFLFIRNRILYYENKQFICLSKCFVKFIF